MKKSGNKRKFTVLVLFLFCLTAAFGQERERIIRFHADITIDVNGRIEVAEHIKVFAAGKEIRRGIIREIPLYRKNKKGKRVPMAYKILAIQCDGQDTWYEIENEDGNMIINLGNQYDFLDRGEHEFTVVYESYGQIGFFDDRDELYWNVTGNTSIFSVEEASATITLPGGAQVVQTDCYTGKYGATEKACTVDGRGNIQAFASTRILSPGEGLTVAVGFTRDIIDRSEVMAAEARENRKALLKVIICALICIGYFLVTRLMAGKVPRKEVAIPTFRPPRDLSPASACVLDRRHYDKKALAAILIEMAVKGAIAIRNERKGQYLLFNRKDTTRLRPEEQEVHAALFAQADRLRLDNSFDSDMYQAGKKLETAMSRRWQLTDFYPDTVRRIREGGILLNVIFLLYQCIAGGSGLAFLLAAPFVTLEWITMITAGPTDMTKKEYIAISCIIALFWPMFPMSIGDDPGNWLSWLFFAGLSLIYIMYAFSMKLCTPEGAKLVAELEGFKMYMKTAEEHRLNLLTPPERTPELLERLLPYAIALGVGNKWCKKFGSVLELSNYRPDWYDGNLKGVATAAGLATSFSALSRSFSTSVSASSTRQSSGSGGWSSGSSGGGHSGGGGGGGGVRGR